MKVCFDECCQYFISLGLKSPTLVDFIVFGGITLYRFNSVVQNRSVTRILVIIEVCEKPVFLRVNAPSVCTVR